MPENLNQLDLYLSRRQADYQVSDRDAVDLQATAGGDLATVTGCANLIQAILNRLFTRKGELTQLGHPNYGSRLYTLIGELNNTRTRALAELFIRESLAQERRIQEITRIAFVPPSRGIDRNVLSITIAVKPIGQDNDIAFTIALNLEG